MLLIVDDVQMGCGRTGPFLSFEEAGIVPDIVCLSKSIGGFGTPMAMTLFRPELDIWEPGEHNGTFRGYNPAFVTATAALNTYWRTPDLQESTLAKGAKVGEALDAIAAAVPSESITSKGRGLARGLAFDSGELARKVCTTAFERGLLMETAGPNGEVAKLMPALTITDEELDQGLAILREAVLAIA
jgi:diaminobutyrate-2-oxoglutarate transaminase